MLDDALKTRIDNEIASESVVLFMKGTPVFPQCGFSAAVVGVLSHIGVKFRGINVLEDDSQNDGWVGAFLYAAHHGITAIHAPPPIDLVAEEQAGKLLIELIAAGIITTAHDISDGGLAVAIAEMTLNSSFGAHIKPPAAGHLHGWAFGEDQARYVVTTADGVALTKAAQKAGIAISKIGTVTSKTELQFGEYDTISVEELKNLSEACLPDLMAG